MKFSTVFFYIVGVSAFCLCAQSIVVSSNPIFFSLLSIVTVSIFIFCRGSAVPVIFILALGPVINMASLYYDPYIYNVEITILVYTGCYFFKNARKLTIINIDRAAISYFVMLLFIFISAFIHVLFYGNNLYAEIRLVRVFLIGGFLLAFLITESKTPVFLYYKTVLSVALLISLTGLIEFAARGILSNNWMQEPRSLLSGSESLAVFLCTTIPFILIGKKSFEKGIWLLISDITVFCGITLLLITRSRTGILSLCIFLFFYIIQIIRNRSGKSALIVFIFGCVAFLSIVTVSLKTIGTARYHLDNLFVGLFSSRIEAWFDGFRSFSASPIWGNGPVNNAYNLYIQLLSQFGITGLLSFLIFLLFTFAEYFKKKHRHLRTNFDKGIFWSIIALLIAGLGESPIGNQLGYYSLFLFLLAGSASRFNNFFREIE